MTDDKIPPNANDRNEQGKPEPEDQQAQQSQGRPIAPPEQHVTRGRMPLFRR
jgi:hypothetical protein